MEDLKCLNKNKSNNEIILNKIHIVVFLFYVCISCVIINENVCL